MTYGIILNSVNHQQKAIIRRLEDLKKKLINAEEAVLFNRICLREGILPRYTNVRLYSEAVRRNQVTIEYRRTLVEDELHRKRNLINDLKDQIRTVQQEWDTETINPETRINIQIALQNILTNFKESTRRRGTRKLARFNGGQIKFPQPSEGYTNLTNLTLDDDEKELLQLGLNCHVLSKPKPHSKRVETEVLLDNILHLAAEGKVTITQRLQPELIAEAGKTRGNFTSKILQQKHVAAAKRLRNNPNITIRRADKAATYVILPTDDYNNKIDTILNDSSKFQPITRNPIPEITKKINSTVGAINAVIGSTKFRKVSGEYQPGYCYGNVKTHKPGNPLRPIISQIPTPTYQLAKNLNQLITPFVPAQYSLSSPTEFLDLVKDSSSAGCIASLDVESLFTNVPVDRTINYICQKIYHQPNHPGLDIPEPHLRTLLELCTKEAPFRCPRGRLFKQKDGVAMGSPLGVLFANMFMGCVEEEVFAQIPKPEIYTRYIDDIFVKVSSMQDLENLRNKLMEISGLNFTIENSTEGALPFLDVLLQQKEDTDSFGTSVYVKPTNPGLCLQGESECPQRYKESTMSAFFRRALTHCSTWRETQKEIDRVHQLLVNNGYANKDIQRKLRQVISKWYQGEQRYKNDSGTSIRLFYKGHMSTHYKEDERVMQDIVRRNVIPTNEEDKIHLTIYYKNKKTSSLLMKNNACPKPEGVKQSHVVYKFTCPKEDCTPLASYVGLTTTTLSRRLTLHLQQGGPKEHMRRQHGIELQRECLVQHTEIIATESDPRRLAFLEALYIKELQPTINNQVQDLAILPSRKPINLSHLHRPAPSGTRRPQEQQPPAEAGRPQEELPPEGTDAPTEEDPIGEIPLHLAPSGARRPQEVQPPAEARHPHEDQQPLGGTSPTLPRGSARSVERNLTANQD